MAPRPRWEPEPWMLPYLDILGLTVPATELLNASFDPRQDVAECEAQDRMYARVQMLKSLHEQGLLVPVVPPEQGATVLWSTVVAEPEALDSQEAAELAEQRLHDGARTFRVRLGGTVTDVDLNIATGPRTRKDPA